MLCAAFGLPIRVIWFVNSITGLLLRAGALQCAVGSGAAQGAAEDCGVPCFRPRLTPCLSRGMGAHGVRHGTGTRPDGGSVRRGGVQVMCAKQGSGGAEGSGEVRASWVGEGLASCS